MWPFNLFTGAFGLKGMAIAAGVAFLAGSIGGWRVNEAFCDAAAARVELANVQSKLDAAHRDLKVSQQAAANSINAAAVIALRASESEEKIRDLETDLAKKPVACRGLDADGLRRLLNIAPR